MDSRKRRKGVNEREWWGSQEWHREKPGRGLNEWEREESWGNGGERVVWGRCKIRVQKGGDEGREEGAEKGESNTRRELFREK